MVTVNTYITYNGYCEEAFLFYKSVFGGEFSYFGRFKEMPMPEGKICPPGDAEKIMHVSLPISKETAIMGSDSFESFGAKTVYGNNFSLSINAESKMKPIKCTMLFQPAEKWECPWQMPFGAAILAHLLINLG
jgi:PhnB protein